MKVSELDGAELDYWVAVAEGYTMERQQDMQMIKGNHRILVGPQDSYQKQYEYSPSTNWAQGGPIIDKLIADGFGLSPGRDGGCNASTKDRESIPFNGDWDRDEVDQDGDTALISAMRAYVASKFGDTVPDQAVA